MSTRGGIGRVEGDGTIVFVYQHFDSYPSELAKELLARYHSLGDDLQQMRAEAIDDHRQGWSSYPDYPYPAEDEEMVRECHCPVGDYTHCDALFIEWLYVLNTSGLGVYKSASTGQTQTNTRPSDGFQWQSPLYRHAFVGTLPWDSGQEEIDKIEEAGYAVHEAEFEKYDRATVQ